MPRNPLDEFSSASGDDLESISAPLPSGEPVLSAQPPLPPAALVPGMDAMNRATQVLAGMSLSGDPVSNILRIEDWRASGFPLTGEAVDGDTLRRMGGSNLRLYGVDAPEHDQRGWGRSETPVPIRQRATNALDALVTPEAVARDYLGQSYGRPVATVDQAGQDVGKVAIRAGNALAAPEFMGRTPDLRGDYMEAERLARQNRLGVHRVYRPADNSGHLDGSSFDLLPPPGKSMGWLKEQVRCFRPNARLLDEADHLHVTFPGWYGAPVLGGARAAGLVNPMAVR